MVNKKFYVNKLNLEFKQRTLRNSSYSIRSFARDLDIDSSSLSSIMKGTRKIPKTKIEYIAARVCTDDNELESFMKSADHDHVTLKSIRSKEFETERHQVSEEDFAVISDIGTYTLLSMIELENFKYDKTWMAKKLKVDVPTVEKRINSLIHVGLIKEFEGSIVRTKKRTTTTDDVASKYISKHHTDSLKLAIEKCETLPPSERYFSTVTIPCDLDSIEHVKKLFIEFEDKMEAYLRTLKKKDVFKLQIQFYQATEKDK